MTDRELLELAAKAAGLTARWHDYKYHGPTMELMESESGGPPWNPLDNDSDALQLAVQLGMYINIYINSMHQTNVGVFNFIVEEPHGDDPCAATRRAIVRAAAAKIQQRKGENHG